MRGATRGPRYVPRVFARYAAIALLPVVALGIVLAETIRNEANRRGLAEGRSEAVLVARTAVEPLLGARPLNGGIDRTEQQGLSRLAERVIAEDDVLRLRIRDLSGRVVFSGDGSGLRSKEHDDDDDALEAARGEVVAHLTRLNSDSNDTGRIGTKSVEVYLPLTTGAPGRRTGVLEIYLPYAPISHDVTADLHMLYLDLAIGLGLLYLALFAITASVSRGLRRAASVNAFLAEHDPLTDLPNRTLFRRRASSAVAAAGHSERPAQSRSSTSTASRTSTMRSAIKTATGSSSNWRPGSPAICATGTPSPGSVATNSA